MQQMLWSLDDEHRDSRTLSELRWMAELHVNEALAKLLALQVMGATTNGDWPVRRAAMLATLQRCREAHADEVNIVRKPMLGRRLGPYVLAAGVVERRWHHVVLRKLLPLRGGCDCRDFGTNALGLCHHVLAVVMAIRRREGGLGAARAEPAYAPSTPLTWDPIRPLVGMGDSLERVHWRERGDIRKGAKLRQARSAFDMSSKRLRSTFPDDAKKRLVLMHTLLDVTERSHAPAVHGLLEREVSHLQRVVPCGPSPTSWERTLKRRLYPHQVQAVHQFLGNGRQLLGDDMGLGKTTQAVAASHALYEMGRVTRGLIIVPASLKTQWLREWRKVTDTPAAILEGRPDQRRAQVAACDRGFLILNYELLRRDVDALRDMSVDLVVLDEAQRIKNAQTKTAAAVKSLQPAYRLALTGTPIENRMEELGSIYAWVDDRVFAPTWRIAPWHSMTSQDGEQGEVIGARHLTTLRLRMRDTFVRRVRKDVLRDLPPCTEARVGVPITASQHSAHAKFDRFIAELVAISKRRKLKRDEFVRLMQFFARQRIICNGMALANFESVWPRIAQEQPRSVLRELHSPKLQSLRRIVKRHVLRRGDKVLIFSQWRRMLRLAHWAIADLLHKRGQRAVFFTGRESQRQRTRGIVEIHDDPHTTVMLLSDAGGVGLNLQRAASICINLELPWNPAVLAQRVARLHRIGQDEPVQVYNLVSHGGIESRIARLVASKQELFTTIFDSDEDEVLFRQASAMTQVAKLILEEATR